MGKINSLLKPILTHNINLFIYLKKKVILEKGVQQGVASSF